LTRDKVIYIVIRKSSKIIKQGVGKMITKSASKIAEKWARVTSGRTEDYEDGVRNPKKDWEAETKAAETRYEDGIKAAITRKAFGKGVAECGTATQQKKTIEKGIIRWPEGVRVAQDDMRAGMEKVVKVLEATKLPPAYAKGDPRNLERVKVVTQALHQMKVGK